MIEILTIIALVIGIALSFGLCAYLGSKAIESDSPFIFGVLSILGLTPFLFMLLLSSWIISTFFNQ